MSLPNALGSPDLEESEPQPTLEDLPDRPVRHLDVASAEASLAHDTATHDDPLWSALVELARVALKVGPAESRAALTVVEQHGRPESSWASDGVAARLDAIQYRQRRGPAWDVATTGGWVCATVPDLVETQGSPALTTAAEMQGVSSLLSVSLAVFAPALLLVPGWSERPTQGSLTLYASEPAVFTETAIDTVLTATGHAALSLTARARIGAAEQTTRDLASQLRAGLESRAAIGRAQGILMERHKINQQEAFDLLRTVSMRGNRKLRDVADELVSATGQGGKVGGGSRRHAVRQ